MKAAYPIILTKGKHGDYIVYIPDFNINTEGSDISDAMFMARDAIGLMGLDLQDDGQIVPAPSSIDSIDATSADIVTLVDVDFDVYRRLHDNKTVRKNCTIPNWLNEMAIAEGVNFSEVLVNGLKQILQK